MERYLEFTITDNRNIQNRRTGAETPGTSYSRTDQSGKISSWRSPRKMVCNAG